MHEVKTPESKERIRRQLSNIGTLPSVPHVITEVSSLLDNERTSAADLCKVISRDQAIVTKILAIANSPLYGLPRRVATVEFAIVIIGFEHMRNVLVALSLVDAFKSRSGANWNHDSYWMHSLLTATAAKRIADDLRYPKSGEVFTAALLHDLGLVVLQRYMNYDFNNIVKLVQEQQISYFNAEKIVLGFTHQEIAEYLLEKWNFPTYITEAVSNHHTPSLSDNGKVLSSLIHLADYMTQRIGIGTFEWDDNYIFDENIIEILGFGSMDYLDGFIASYEPLFRGHMESLLEKTTK
ncbi:MAG: HDOD domain-containing protein [Bacteroidetes bacterium]|nr:HDOD domain-containing protein [Bacteroidota bacterium]